jgi:hypothetical protein
MPSKFDSRLAALERVFGAGRAPTPAEIANARAHLEQGHTLPDAHPGKQLARHIADVLAAIDATMFGSPDAPDACKIEPPLHRHKHDATPSVARSADKSSS